MSISETASASPPTSAPVPDRDGARPSAADRHANWRPLIWVAVAIGAAVPPNPSPLLAGLMVVAGACMTMAVRIERVGPRLVLFALAATIGLVAAYVAPGNGLGVVPIFAAPALVAREVQWRRAVIVFGAVATVACVVALFWVGRTGWASLGASSIPFITMGTWNRAALRREHARVLDLLDELEARRDADVRAAAATERARIARDLHDVLAHTLSGLSLHLQAIRAVLAGRPDTPTEVISSVDRAADLARTGLDEARHAVAALREDSGRAPGSGELAALVAGHDGAALAVDGDFDTLGPAARQTAFATVRESLTNAERHAPGARVSVRVTVDEQVVVRVHDDGAARPVTAGDDGGGAGLAGLAERAASVGGTLLARPDPPGWTVELRIPGPTTDRGGAR